MCESWEKMGALKLRELAEFCTESHRGMSVVAEACLYTLKRPFCNTVLYKVNSGAFWGFVQKTLKRALMEHKRVVKGLFKVLEEMSQKQQKSQTGFRSVCIMED